MPLTIRDKQFLNQVSRLKIYLLILAGAVYFYLLLIPNDIQMETSVVGLALCGVFWLTSRLLTYITILDLELMRLLQVIRRILPSEERKEFFPDD